MKNKQPNKNKSKLWVHIILAIVVVLIYFCFPVYILAADSYSQMEVGKTTYASYSAGSTYVSYWVGVAPPTAPSTTSAGAELAKILLPIVGVVVIIMWVIKIWCQQTIGFVGHIKLLLGMVLSSAILVAVIMILNDL
jgi:hypothetical protein